MNHFLASLTLCVAAGGLFAEAAAPAVDHANKRANLGAGRAERCDKALGALKEKHPELFKRVDTDGDGEINGGEFHAFLERREAAFKEKHPDLFAAIDANDDGEIDKHELKSARDAREERFKAKHPKAFDKVDQNDNGKLGPREVRDARQRRGGKNR